MANNKKIKKSEGKIVKPCTNCFQPQYIKFNFSFITYEDDLSDKDKIQIYNRLKELSSEPYLIVSSWDRKKGFENVKVNIKKQIKSEFYGGHRNFDGNYTIIRLYPNNNPTPGRIIGKMINKIFYIFFIDSKGKLYSHDWQKN